MRRRTWTGFLGGLGACALAAGWWATHRPAPAPQAASVSWPPAASPGGRSPSALPAVPAPAAPRTGPSGKPIAARSLPAPPTAAAAPGDATASFTRATGSLPAQPLQVVTLPWDARTQWAVEPALTHVGGNAPGTLWFGARTGSGPWTWIPTTLPGALDPRLPKPAAQALQWAFDLAQGEPGPALPGRIQWAALAGHVGLPAGWTLAALPAAASPLGTPSVGITVWVPSHTGVFSGVYGVETAWNARNAATGDHGLAALVAAPSLAEALAPATP